MNSVAIICLILIFLFKFIVFRVVFPFKLNPFQSSKVVCDIQSLLSESVFQYISNVCIKKHCVLPHVCSMLFVFSSVAFAEPPKSVRSKTEPPPAVPPKLLQNRLFSGIYNKSEKTNKTEHVVLVGEQVKQSHFPVGGIKLRNFPDSV